MEKRSKMENMEIKHVLVTGDNGYIGSVLVQLLLDKGYLVTGLDTQYYKNKLDPQKIVSYPQIKKDIRKVTIRDLKDFDAVIHLAALSNDPMGALNPKLTDTINHLASINLAKLSKKAGVKRFLFSSSCSIYGIAKNGIVDETSPVTPLTEYAKSKIKVEKQLQKMATKNFCVGLLRNSTVYGYSPKFRDDLVVNNLTVTGYVTKVIKVLSDGTPWRPLIDVRDLSNIFAEFLVADSKSINGEVINIGFKENNFQVKDLVEVVQKNLKDCKVEFTGEHGSDTRSYKVNFNKFSKKFPNVSQNWPIEKSVKDLIIHLKNANFTKKDLDNGTYTRLKILTKLKDNGKLTNSLYWK